ncbi:MAG: hypothetical protein QM674_07445 [Burkholderiaceae bacterium]
MSVPTVIPPPSPPRAVAARRPARLAALLVSAALLGGCASLGPSGVRPGGLTLTEIVAMLDAKQPQADIAKAIKQRGLAAQASADDVQMLENKGAKNEVIDAVLIASWDDSNDVRYARGYGYGYPYYYGDPFWSPWPWGIGYGIGYYGWGGAGYYRPGPWYGGGHWGGRPGFAPAPPIRQGMPRSPGFGAPRPLTPRR